MPRYESQHVIVTGGLGFIGSNLVLRLVNSGARVTVVDCAVSGCGANDYNLHPALDRVRVIRADIGDAASFAGELTAASVVFNLAGEISHIHSMRDPERDLQLNTLSQLRFLATLARVNPRARIVYAGTRQVCGRPRYLPVDEDHPIEPVDFNGIHKRAAEHYHLLMSRDGLLDAIVLRLTNVYGPRLAIGVRGQGFLSAFFARLLDGRPLEVFGDGSQLRDPVYVDDAVDAFLLAGAAPASTQRLFHVGGPESLSLLRIAKMMTSAAGLDAGVTLRPFPEEHKAFDIGSYTTDTRRIRAALGWSPRVRFEEGVREAFDYFRRERDHYLPANPRLAPAPAG